MYLYSGTYETIDNSGGSKYELNVSQSGSKLNPVQDMLLTEMKNKQFSDYQTAWIKQTNKITGKEVANYYFSIKDERWHAIPVKTFSYDSWSNGKAPFKQIMRFLLVIFGAKQRQEKEIFKMIQHHKINELYGN